MEISLIGKKIHVPKLVSDWLDFDRAFSAKVMAGDWRNMKEKDLIYAAIQATLAVALVGCAVVGRDLKTQEAPALAYSPSGEIVPVNMFGQDTIFYSAQPAFVELGLSARQVEVVQLGGSDKYQALQLMEVQDKKGEIFYNLMFQNRNGQVEQEWAVLLADSPQSPESVLYQLDLVSTNGHNEFVADMARSVGNLTPTQLQINLPGETGVVPVPTADLIGLFTGVHPVLAADESTSTPIATIAPTPKPTATLIFSTPTETPTLVAVDHMPVGLDKAHQDLWNNAPDKTADGLHKIFLPGGLSNYLAYTSNDGNVVGIYNVDTGKVDNSMLVDEKDLFVNDGTPSIIINPDMTPDIAIAKVGKIVDYLRSRLCASALGIKPPESLDDVSKFLGEINSGCDVSLNGTSLSFNNPRYLDAKKWNYNVGEQRLRILPDTPIVFKFISELDDKEGFVFSYGRNQLDSLPFVEGVKINQTKDGVVVIYIYHMGSGLPNDYDPLSMWLDKAIRVTLDRADGSSREVGTSKNPILESVLFNPNAVKKHGILEFK